MQKKNGIIPKHEAWDYRLVSPHQPEVPASIHRRIFLEVQQSEEREHLSRFYEANFAGYCGVNWFGQFTV
jgi:hypothetical protein